MAFYSYDTKDINNLENQIQKIDPDTGEIKPLFGEITIYRRLARDCASSQLDWYFWHDVQLPIPSGDKSSIQIDFILICKYGMIFIEVKGGRLNIIDRGQYVFTDYSSPLKESPFKQVERYKNSVVNKHLIDSSVFVATACAFPMAEVSLTNSYQDFDKTYKLWSKSDQDDDNKSIADFLVSVIKKDRAKIINLSFLDLTPAQLYSLVEKFSPTIKPNSYALPSITEIQEKLNVDSVDLIESLEDNERLVIEGAPGTGKTTIAKAFIMRNRSFKGLYLCWTYLLGSEMNRVLKTNNLSSQCDVSTYLGFMEKISNGSITAGDLNHLDREVIKDKFIAIIDSYRSECRDYDYLILDETQDTIDKGIDLFIDKMASIGSGLTQGRYLILFDSLQGYNHEGREISSKMAEVFSTAAKYKLTERKRYKNHEIVRLADFTREMNDFSLDGIADIVKNNCFNSVTVERINCTNMKGATIMLFNALEKAKNSKESIVLHSANLNKDFTRLFALKAKEITNKNYPLSEELGYTTIGRFKGLEKQEVYLFVDRKITQYEFYLGITRAIANLKIYICI